ncbi:sugar phosphate isomerase/epimerase family protein [Paenibacillus sacheonensis]|uniref:TIM barrel protein n=1 Tax=Paenibacillus sacheonensis TaxID=742054 RepID=A0A7X4YLM9_9BACL|nr:sugar phosphate isomerase/epimerase family protein [Paenibacillus sacheonensis]MBM7566045.1 sugar phosphate isomerase/epimerase [Paenibacillus sacheonensis]NBC68645.1 TIM barrel protein [Paenibacillus sacheonensis]
MPRPNLQDARVAVFPKGLMDELTNGTITIFDWIEMAASLGVDGLELYPTFLQAGGDEYLHSVKAAAEAHGLAIPMMCSSPDFTNPDENEWEREARRMERMIDVMALLGPEEFRSVRVLSGQNRPGLSREDGIAWTIAGIRRLLPYAEERGVHLVMENHYKDGYWIYPEFAQSSELFLAIVGEIDSPWFGVNFDPSNALLAGEDPLDVMERVKDRILTMHASDRYLKPGYTLDDLREYSLQGYSEALAHGVIGEGLNDYDAIFANLREIGFHRWISIEDGVNGLDEMRQSAVFLRSKLAEWAAKTKE